MNKSQEVEPKLSEGWLWCPVRECRTHTSLCYLWVCTGCERKEVSPAEKTKKVGVAEEPAKKKKHRSKKNQPLEGQLSFLKEEV